MGNDNPRPNSKNCVPAGSPGLTVGRLVRPVLCCYDVAGEKPLGGFLAQARIWLAVLAVLLLQAPPAGATPAAVWGAAYKAFQDPRAYAVQARDKRTEIALRRVLLLDDPASALDVAAVCLMGHVFLAGSLDDPGRRERMVEAARKVNGVRSVQAYLPGKEEMIPGDASALKIKLALFGDQDASPATLTIKAVGGAAALMGVVATEAGRRMVVQAASRAEGVVKVVDFLILPEAGAGKMLQRPSPRHRRRGPLRRLLSP